MNRPKFFWLGCWAFWAILCFCALALYLSGCAAVPKYVNLADVGYNSPEGIAIREGIKAAAGPIVGTDWGNILSVIAGALGGGYAVHKRRKWLDEKPPAGL